MSYKVLKVIGCFDLTSPRLRMQAKLSALAGMLGALLLLVGCSDRNTLLEEMPSAKSLKETRTELLLVADPFANILEQHIDVLNGLVDVPFDLSLRRYAKTRDTILINHQDQSSFYSLVSFDILWLPEFAKDEKLSPLSDADLDYMRVASEYFIPITYEANRVDSALYGLPIQSHLELLWYRKDLLAEKGLRPPQTLAELLEQARMFNDPEAQIYGICWNALRGQALGQTISHMYAAFGGPILSPTGQPQINTKTGEAVLQYLQQLIEVSPPDIFSMAWDQRIDRFARGQAAFTFGWGARSMRVELDPTSRVQGLVGYAPYPGVDVGTVATPLGQWSLGIPAKLPTEQRPQALDMLRTLCSDEVYRLFAENGLRGLHRDENSLDLSELSEVRADSAYAVSRRLLLAGAINPDARPSIKEWPKIAEILGTVFHDVLLERLTIEAGLQAAQAQVESLLEVADTLQ